MLWGRPGKLWGRSGDLWGRSGELWGSSGEALGKLWGSSGKLWKRFGDDLGNTEARKQKGSSREGTQNQSLYIKKFVLPNSRSPAFGGHTGNKNNEKHKFRHGFHCLLASGGRPAHRAKVALSTESPKKTKKNKTPSFVKFTKRMVFGAVLSEENQKNKKKHEICTHIPIPKTWILSLIRFARQTDVNEGASGPTFHAPHTKMT